MELFVGFLIIAAAVTLFVGMVKRTNAKAASIGAIAPQHRPAPLTPSQRKSLGLGTPDKPMRRAAVDEPPSRAMRTGWSRGLVQFTYEDSKGDVTFRTVTVHSVAGNNLKGECHDRNAQRTFRLDRIIGDVVDTATGEVLKPITLRKHFA